MNTQQKTLRDDMNCSCCMHTNSHKSKYHQIYFIMILICMFGVCMLLLKTSLADIDFIPPLAYITLMIIYILSGKPIFYSFWQNCKHKIFFDENSLMLFATLAALCIGELSEAVAVMLFFRVGELLESSAVKKAKNAIHSLLKVMPDIAHKKQNNILIDLHPQSLQIGDNIIVKVGEKIPTDGIITKGKSHIDMRSINGESVPISANEGDYIIAGGINLNAMLEVRVEKLFEDSHIAKIAKLTEEAGTNKAKTQKVITAFAHIYTPIIFIISLSVGLLPPLFDGQWHEWIYRGLVVMMISCPCALIIAVPLGYFAAIGKASKIGVLFKGTIHLETLYQVKNIIFDKTGTLTLGTFEILHIAPQPNYNEKSLLELAALAEQNSNHPIATCIQNAMKAHSEIQSYEEIAGKGIKLICDKGEILAGNAMLLREKNITFEVQDTHHTIVYIAHNGHYAGHILIGDKPKNQLKEDLKTLKAYGIKHFAILSGDSQKNVDYLAKDLGITHAYGELLPSQKEQKLIELMKKWQGKVAFVGDGINDSIVLRRSDVGISINTGENGNDISKESADIILQQNSLQSLIQGYKIALDTHSITWQNIIFALGSKLILIILGILGIANMWLAVFGDVGVALLALLNATRPTLKSK